MTLAPGITLVATPLGNIADASDRLRGALIDADIIAAEDTRRARNLATALGISPKGKFVSNFDHNEESRTESLIQAAKAGQKVIVVTDAGGVGSWPGCGGGCSRRGRARVLRTGAERGDYRIGSQRVGRRPLLLRWFCTS